MQHLRSLALLTILFTLVVIPQALSAQEATGFPAWLQGMKQQALEAGISQATVDSAFKDTAFLPKVIELDRKQPELTFTFDQYLTRVVNKDRIAKGRKLMREHKPLLDRISAKYGVQPRFIVALWGIETNYGGNTGNFAIVDALATLAYEGRRAEFFKKELINALKIIDGGHVDARHMIGSWAGAMGQTQFMPSSFLSYAVDENGDGKRDIWKTQEDIFASIANYLAKVGWDDDLTWGRRVSLPKNFDYSLDKQELDLSAWQAAGVRDADGGNLPDKALKAKLILPSGKGGSAFLVYANYQNILKWNRSNYFAIAVGTLSDAVRYY